MCVIFKLQFSLDTKTLYFANIIVVEFVYWESTFYTYLYTFY